MDRASGGLQTRWVGYEMKVCRVVRVSCHSAMMAGLSCPFSPPHIT